jgi:NADPH:quinone reductase-like Zn-dependent oxidoreductase
LESNLTMKALVLDAEARTAHVRDICKPTPGPSDILVKVEAVSLNPIDPLYVANPLGRTGRTIGSDFAGTVETIGPESAKASKLTVGDHVSGFLQGACSRNDRPGAFAEYLVIPHDLVWKIPESITLDRASAASLVALTAAQGLWYRLGLPAPFDYDRAQALRENPDFPKLDDLPAADTLNIFIYGASTSVALYAAQMARLSGRLAGKKIKLFGTASRARWPMLKAEPFSYDYLVDYRDKDWSDQISKLSGGIGMHYVYDGISEGDSVERATLTLGKDGVGVAIVRHNDYGAWMTTRQLPVTPIYGAVWEGLGEEVQYHHMTLAPSVVARNFTAKFYEWLSEVAGTELALVPIRLMPGGLERMTEDGFRLLGAGTMNDRELKRTEEWMRPISAEKLVYHV